MTNSENVVGTFVRTVLHKVHQQGVNYVVLRNYEGLPDRVGHDIDVLVDSDQFRSFESILFSTAQEQGWHLVKISKRYGFLSCTFASISSGSQIQVLKWDFWFPIFWKGIPWVDYGAVLKAKRPFNGFFIPSPGSEATILCLKDAIQVGAIRREYCQRMWELSIQDPQGFQVTLEKHWGEETVHWLFDRIQQRQWEDIERAIPGLRRTLVIRALCMSPAETVKGVLRFLLSHLRARLQAGGGYFLCFIGPDGSGKSTISRKVAGSLSMVFEDTHYYHGHFGIVPELKTYVQWLGRKSESKDPSSVIGSSAPGLLRGILYLLYYGLDYLLGHLVITWGRGRSGLVIFDRYFYDYVIQPGPFSVENPLFRALLALVPRPDAVIYLRASPEIVHARKPELPVEEIARQSSVCEQLAGYLPNAQVVDNILPADKVTTEVCKTVLEQMAESVEACTKF